MSSSLPIFEADSHPTLALIGLKIEPPPPPISNADSFAHTRVINGSVGEKKKKEKQMLAFLGLS